MAEVVRRRWAGDLTSGLSRRDRRPCVYDAYVPDPLAGRTVALDGEVAADVADAETAIARLNASAEALVDTEALARLLLRAESVASSRIEGLEVGPRRLLRAEVGSELGEAPSDVTAAEVLANVDAMMWAVRAVDDGAPISTGVLLEAHRQLLATTRLREHGGRIRTVQNWIGGSAYNPCAAEFVPPPPERVAALLDDLVAFCNDDSLPAVAQAAIAHAQFETIHPFVDGNGRTGRALIHMILRRRALAPRLLPPVSLVLATWSTDYVEGLRRTRYRGLPTSDEAHRGLNAWMGLFASACRRAVDDADAFERRALRLQEEWRSALGGVRGGSATDLLLRALPGAPVLTVNGAATVIGRSFRAANEAMARLVEAGVLRQVTVGRRNRAFEATDIVDAFTDLERRLASPDGDTRSGRLGRPVPRRAVR